jgi:hypothetical protein
MMKLRWDQTLSHIILQVFMVIRFEIHVILAPNSGMSSFLLCNLPCWILLVCTLVEPFDKTVGNFSLELGDVSFEKQK